MNKFEQLVQYVIDGEEEQVVELTEQLLDEGNSPLEIINKGLIKAMDIIGPQFQNGEIFIPEVLMAAGAMEKGVEILKPLLREGDMQSKGKVVIATVKEDVHDIGKDLVAMMLESNGYEIINLGTGVSPEQFAEAARKEKPDFVAMSSLLTTSMHHMDDTIALLKEEGINVKTIIGGAPVTQEYADKIGATGYSTDAVTAVELCDELMGV